MENKQAFPRQQWEYDGQGNVLRYQEEGMSLRDYFAAKALQAVPMPQGHQHDTPEVYARIAAHAYKMADAMLLARDGN